MNVNCLIREYVANYRRNMESTWIDTFWIIVKVSIVNMDWYILDCLPGLSRLELLLIYIYIFLFRCTNFAELHEIAIFVVLGYTVSKQLHFQYCVS